MLPSLHNLSFRTIDEFWPRTNVLLGKPGGGPPFLITYYIWFDKLKDPNLKPPVFIWGAIDI